MAGIPISPELDTPSQNHSIAISDDLYAWYPLHCNFINYCYYPKSTFAVTGLPAENGGPLPAHNEPDDKTQAGDGSQSLWEKTCTPEQPAAKTCNLQKLCRPTTVNSLRAGRWRGAIRNRRIPGEGWLCCMLWGLTSPQWESICYESCEITNAPTKDGGKGTASLRIQPVSQNLIFCRSSEPNYKFIRRCATLSSSNSTVRSLSDPAHMSSSSYVRMGRSWICFGNDVV